MLAAIKYLWGTSSSNQHAEYFRTSNGASQLRSDIKFQPRRYLFGDFKVIWQDLYMYWTSFTHLLPSYGFITGLVRLFPQRAVEITAWPITDLTLFPSAHLLQETLL